MPKVTIRDIADLAGTSFKTVSRVINGEERVSDELRLRVRRAMAELGYRPDRAAQTLRGGRNYALCILTEVPVEQAHESEGPPAFISSAMAGALTSCQEAGYQLVFEALPSESGGIEDIEERLRFLRSDGVILFPPLADRRWLLDQLETIGIPYVRLVPGTEPEMSACFAIDDYAAGRELGQMFLAYGHRHVACIAGPADHIAASRRSEGFKAAIEERPEARIDTYSGDFMFASGLSIGKHILTDARRPTAIFAANDIMALGVMAAARDFGLSLPRELSIAGFDDAPVARFVRPSLTTVSQSVRLMGELAAKQLIEAALGKVPLAKRVWEIPYRLEVRESVASPQQVPTK